MNYPIIHLHLNGFPGFPCWITFPSEFGGEAVTQKPSLEAISSIYGTVMYSIFAIICLHVADTYVDIHGGSTTEI